MSSHGGVTDRERYSPTREELDDLLGLLVAANEQGQLKAIAFVLQGPPGTMLDHRGNVELTGILGRTVLERLADHVQAVEPAIARAMRSDAAGGVRVS